MKDVIEAGEQISARTAASGHLAATFVEALHSEIFSLVYGAVFFPLLAVYICYREKQIALIIASGALAAAGVARLATTLLYRRCGTDKTPLQVEFWKKFTLVSVLAFSTWLGIFAYVAVARTDDYRLHLLALLMVIGYAAGTVRRNAGLQAGMPAQLVLTVVVLAVALAQKDDYIYRVVSIIVIFAFFMLRAMSKSVHDEMVSTFKSSEEKEVLLQAITEKSERFDAALSNMPHGLAMVDADCRVVVANDKFRELLNLPRSGDDNAPIESLFESSIRNGILPPEWGDLLVRMVRDSAGDGSPEEIEIGASGGQTLNLAFQPKARGGCVITVMDVTDRKAVERITHLAHHDKLTGLPNRRFFDEQFASTLHAGRQGGERLAVMALDLDRFKAVNDTLGHPVGDELLRVASNRIRRLIGPQDFVSRFGGDEFMLIHHCGADGGDAEGLARRLIDAVSEPYIIAGNDVAIGLTVGVAHFPEDGGDRQALLRNADLALYQAKRDRRGACRLFEPRMDAEARDRRQLEIDLRKALDQDQIELAYQPIVNVATGRIAGCEALLRWRHPEKGLLPAARFIPLAEETGMFLDIGGWSIEIACRDAAGWAGEKTVAVNLSTIQFRRNDLVATVKDALAASGLAAARLELEITEATLAADKSVRHALTELRRLGVSIVLDNFGTGLFSLGSIVDGPIDKVKLDRSLIASLPASREKRAIVQTIATLAGELGLILVADGVETAEELQIVRMKSDSMRPGLILLGAGSRASDPLGRRSQSGTDASAQDRLAGLPDIDAAAAVPQEKRRAGQQDVESAEILPKPVGRQPGQGEQMVHVLGKDHAGPRRDGGREAGLGGQSEFARAGRTGVAIRISEMPAGLPQLALQAKAAVRDFRAGRRDRQSRRAADGSANGRRWSPGHGRPVRADRPSPRHSDSTSARASIPACAESVATAAMSRSSPPPRSARLRRSNASFFSAASVASRPSVDPVQIQLDHIETADRFFEFDPPQPSGAIGEAGRDVEGRRGVVALQRGQHMVEQVAVAVIEGQRGKGAAFAADQPRHGFIKRDDSEPRFAQAGQDGVEEIRRDLEQGVGREIAALRRTNPMKGQDDAPAAQEIAPEPMQARGAKQAESGRDRAFLPIHPGQDASPLIDA